MLYVKEEKDGVFFKVRVQPRSSRNQVAGLYEDAVKIRLTAAPVDGKANEDCRAYLAELFAVPRSQVAIVSGHAGRNKMIKVTGLSIEKIIKALGV